MLGSIVKFIYSEKALLLNAVHTVKSKGKISQNFVAFSEYMNFNKFKNFILGTDYLYFLQIETKSVLLFLDLFKLTGRKINK